MDFISLATATNEVTSNIRRRLLEDTTTTTASTAVSSIPLGADGSTTNDIAMTTATKPLLSPSAENELFKLCTNFLLYVAMVIIITLMCKVYFPDLLERNLEPHARKASYVRVDTNGDGGEGVLYSSSDDSDEDEDSGDDSDDEDSDESDSDSDSGSDEDSDEDESDEDEENKKNKNKKNFLQQKKKKSLQQQEETNSSQHRSSRSSHSTKRSRSNSHISLEFDIANTPKATVMKRLLFCSFMLNVTFITWGVLQERMLTRRYPRYTGEFFVYSYALVFFNRFWTFIMSGLLMLYLSPKKSKSTVIYEYSFPSISNMLSSWCQYEALRYVSFPAQTLFKSFKLVPVMVMGKILGNKDYPTYDYAVAIVIGCGISLFMHSTDGIEFGYDIHNTTIIAEQKWTGIMLLCFFLFFDSFTGQWQSRMFTRHRDLSMIELLFATSAFSTFLSLITLIHQKELGPAIDFLMEHSEIHVHFFLFSVCSTVGQLFIFYTIKNFGAVVFTIIMTLRVLLSIAVSCVLYGHPVNSNGFIGLFLVVVAILYRIKRKAEGTQLIKWQGMADEKGVELFQEWHEHLDT